MMNIDVHHHAVPETLLQFIAENEKAVHKEYRTIDGKQCLIYTDNQFVQPIYPIYYDDALRFEKMKQMRLDMVVLAISPAHFNYELETAVTAETSRIINDWLGEKQQKYPDKYRGMMTLPMQDNEAALAELDRAYRKYGMKSLEIASQIGGKNLDDPSFFPVFEYCAKNGITVCLHPYCPVNDDPSFSKYYTTNLVRFPLQTGLALATLVLGGVFERLPGLNVVAFHGGGHFPYQFGRIEHGWQVRQEPKTAISGKPRDYLGQIYFDTITHSAPALQFLVDAFGAEHVLIGTDMPYDMGDETPVSSVDALRLTAAQRDAISCANAQALFGI